MQNNNSDKIINKGIEDFKDIELNEIEKELISIFEERKVPYIVVRNKVDKLDYEVKDVQEKLKNDTENISKELVRDVKRKLVYTSSVEKIGIEELKNEIGSLLNKEFKENHFVSDLIKPKSLVILITPIDSSAPKGRMIMPQQLAIRDIIDANSIAIVTKETELVETLESLKRKPDLVITDSQVFEFVNNIVPQDIKLTSFSILMARYKGFLKEAVNGIKKIEKLNENSKILISEGCTHHRQCEDIGTVKLPNWIKKYTGLELNFEWSSGNEFPKDLSKYDLIIHCGGCMLNYNEMQYRMNLAVEQGIPFTNYGIAIAYMKGILDRSLKAINF